MARIPGAKKSRFFIRLGKFGAVFVILSSLGLITLLVLDMIGVNILIDETGPRSYWIQFKSEERMLLDMKYKRGEKFEIPADPKHSEDEYFEFIFRGWDISGDNVPDLIPNRAYYSFLAVAVYQKKQVKPFPSSNSEEDSSEDLLSEPATYIGGVNNG